MYATDTITNYDDGGLTTGVINKLNAAGIYNWQQAKDAVDSGRIFGVQGVGAKSMKKIELAEVVDYVPPPKPEFLDIPRFLRRVDD